MKKIFVLAVTVVCAVMAQAADYPYLVFTNTAGTTTVMSVTSLTITVSGSSLQVTNSDGTETFTLSDLASMQFSVDGSTTAIEEVPSDKVPSDKVPSTKVLRDGQVLILRGNRLFTTTGIEIQ